MGKKFCYWTVADGNHGKMMATTVASARKVGVTQDFHVWTDMPEIPGATVHPCGTFDKTLYMFKFHFLKNEVAKLDYDYFVFLDADNYFVANPGDLGEMMGSDKVFIQMENDCDPPRCKRKDWWSCPIGEYEKFMLSMGVKPGKMYNTNAGFWIVAKTAIIEFYDRATYIFDEAHKRGYSKTTEEFALAGVGMIMQDREKHTFDDTNWLWSSDWTGQWKDKIPTYDSWQFEDYMSGDKKMVKPKIVHAMRSKDVMIKEYEASKVAQATSKIEKGYWIGHQLLGDVIGFVAAAHLLSVKTGQTTYVNFQESRKGILDYFDGVEWVPKESIQSVVDCGGNPTLEEWPNSNGVKRFYKWMDSSMTNPKSFDIHMKVSRNNVGQKLIGLVTHANTQGDIPNSVVDDMVAQAREKYPSHRIVAIGNKDNSYVPQGVEDMRQTKGDIKWIVEMVRKLDLLITPQSGPCFIAAGFKVPMWVYRSKEAFWDYVLNYDEYKVEKWWEREVVKETMKPILNNLQSVKVKNIDYFVRPGTWDHSILHDSSDYSVSRNICFPSNTCIVDIGGHIGGFTKIVASMYPYIHIYTFEPDPENFSVLKKNVENIPNITIFNAGVGAEDCFGSMESPSIGNTGMNRFVKNTGNVEILSPSSLFKKIKHYNIGIMKIDCEGGEWGFFDKMTSEERSRIWEIQGELHTDLFSRYPPFKAYPSYNDEFLRKFIKEKLPEFNVFLDATRIIKAYNKNNFI